MVNLINKLDFFVIIFLISKKYWYFLQEVFLFLFSTLDEAAMRTVAILLKGLPLQPDCVDQDITEAKSELFLK